jgi:hypothetical protein
MIQEALDALPEEEDVDIKCSNFNSNQELVNGDLTSNPASQSNIGCSLIDIALCQLADEEFSTF